MEKLSKSLQDGRKLAAGESYQDLNHLLPAIDEDHTVKYRHADKNASCGRQRPKSLNFEIFIGEQGENKTDDEKIEDSNGSVPSLNGEVTSKVSPTEEQELNYALKSE